MVADTVMKYRGVLCWRCQKPIPLSARIASVEAKLRRGDLTHVEELGPRAFALRCRSCHREGLYFGSQFIDCEGTPLSRESGSKRSSSHSHTTSEIARAANG